jgi:phenylacetate-CoA ligase
LFRRDLETLDAEDRRDLQSTRLARLIDRLTESQVPYWVEKLRGVGEVRSVEEVVDLPFTEKAEFRETYPHGMISIPLEQVVRVHASSGTSGKPTIVAYSVSDVEVFAEVVARSLSAAGAVAEDVVQVSYGYGLFTGGLGLHYGVEALGARVVPASGGNPGFQVGLLADLGVTGLAATPSFALLLAERAAAMGLMDRIRLRWGVHGAEPWSEAMRARIEGAWGSGYQAVDIYGLSEVIGPGVGAECRENKGGLHVFEDHFLIEIVDPDSGDPAPEGEPGELVVTTLTKEAQPVVRYRTRDITRLLPGPCPCGRTTRRIARVEGRADDMLIIRGVNVYPRTIEELLMSDPALGPNYAIVVDRRGPLPELEARVELADDALLDQADTIGRRLRDSLIETVRIRVEVQVGPPGSIPRTEVGKTKRVFERTSEEDPVGVA